MFDNIGNVHCKCWRTNLASKLGYYLVAEGDTLTNVKSMQEKESVDTGRFIPGEYRVNPYLHRSGSYRRDGTERPYLGMKQSVPRWKYDYHLEISGDVFAEPLEATRQKLLVDDFAFGNEPRIALQKAYAKIGQPDVGVGENLGELRETLTTLRHPFKNLRDFLYSHDHYNLGLLNKLLHYLKTGKWSDHGGRLMDAKDAILTASGAWMELRYGIRPIMYTVQDIIKMVNEKSAVFDPGIIHTSRSTYLSESYGSQFKTQTTYNSFGSCEVEVACKLSRRSSAAVQYTQELEYTLAERLGLTPAHLTELVWELTRASFVVDWWFSVGDWLGSYRVRPKVKILGNTVGKKVTAECFGRGRIWIANIPLPEKRDIPATSMKNPLYTVKSYQRLVNQDLPLFPLVTLHLPDLFETVDSVALILQGILGKIKKS